MNEIRFTSEPGRGDRWAIVSGEVITDGYRDAVSLFDDKLARTLDASAVVFGAGITSLGASTLVEKKRSKYAFLHAVKRRKSAHLTFPSSIYTQHAPEVATVASRMKRSVQDRYGANFLRQAALSESVVTTTLHLLQSAAAMCQVPAKNKTDHRAMRALMGDELFEFFYVRDPVIGDKRRNALAHGRMIEELSLTPRAEELSAILLDALRTRFAATATPSFSPMRGFATYERIGLFVEVVKSPLPSIFELARMAERSEIHSGSNPRWVGIDKDRRLRRTF